MRSFSFDLLVLSSELMLLGFISLLLTVGQGPIAEICVPKAVANSWHPCDKKQETSKHEVEKEVGLVENGSQRRLLDAYSAYGGTERRILAGAGYDTCSKNVCQLFTPFLQYPTKLNICLSYGSMIFGIYVNTNVFSMRLD